MLISMIEQCRQEVDQLHQFFEDWFNGNIQNGDDTFGRFAKVLGEDFRIISPNANVTPKSELAVGLKSAYGIWTSKEPGWHIYIKNFEGRTLGQGICLVTYEEWQGPSIEDTQKRRSSALFRSNEEKPLGVEWVHVHETWMG